MKTTKERIEEIVKEQISNINNGYKFTPLDEKILRLELENLVTQAKLEQLRGEK